MDGGFLISKITETGEKTKQFATHHHDSRCFSL